MYRHRFHGSTTFSFQDIIESMIFSNGGTNWHKQGTATNPHFTPALLPSWVAYINVQVL